MSRTELLAGTWVFRSPVVETDLAVLNGYFGVQTAMAVSITIDELVVECHCAAGDIRVKEFDATHRIPWLQGTALLMFESRRLRWLFRLHPTGGL